MSDAEVMTTALVASRYFAGSQQTACAILKTLRCIPSILRRLRYNRRLQRIPTRFQTLFEYLVEVFKAQNLDFFTFFHIMHPFLSRGVSLILNGPVYPYLKYFVHLWLRRCYLLEKIRKSNLMQTRVAQLTKKRMLI